MSGWQRAFQPLEEAAGVFSDRSDELPVESVRDDLKFMKQFLLSYADADLNNRSKG